MTVLDRSELEASPLADLHVIADQIGLEGFRRLRKADLINAILGEEGTPSTASGSDGSDSDSSTEEREPRTSSRRSRSTRSRRGGSGAKAKDADTDTDTSTDADSDASDSVPSARRARGRGEREKQADPERTAEGVVEILGNGSAFLRVEPPEPSEQDVYISAAQVRRCELVSGDRVGGPVRTPRRSERYPSLVRVDTINGQPADSVTEGTRYDELPVSYPSERLALESGEDDPTLKAIEWLTPLGLGSRAVIVGAPRSGKTEALRRILAAVRGREGLETMLVLAGVRPEEVAEWQAGQLAPTATLDFAASPDAQGHAVESVVETGKRIAARGGNALILIDGLDGLHPHAARKALAAARNLTDSGSLTVIATATRPFGGETAVIALSSNGGLPTLDLLASGTIKPELLVGDDGAKAIADARATAAAEG